MKILSSTDKSPEDFKKAPAHTSKIRDEGSRARFHGLLGKYLRLGPRSRACYGFGLRELRFSVGALANFTKQEVLLWKPWVLLPSLRCGHVPEIGPPQEALAWA